VERHLGTRVARLIVERQHGAPAARPAGSRPRSSAAERQHSTRAPACTHAAACFGIAFDRPQCGLCALRTTVLSWEA